MEDTKEWFVCEHCDGEFTVETDLMVKEYPKIMENHITGLISTHDSKF